MNAQFKTVFNFLRSDEGDAFGRGAVEVAPDILEWLRRFAAGELTEEERVRACDELQKNPAAFRKLVEIIRSLREQDR